MDFDAVPPIHKPNKTTVNSPAKSKNSETGKRLKIKRRVNDRSTNDRLAKKARSSYRSESSNGSLKSSSPIDLNCKNSHKPECAIDLSTKTANHDHDLKAFLEPSKQRIIKNSPPVHQNSSLTTTGLSNLSPFYATQSNQILLNQLYPLNNYNLLNYLINSNALDGKCLSNPLDQFNSKLKLLMNDLVVHQPKQIEHFSFDQLIASSEAYNMPTKFADQPYNALSDCSLWKRIFLS